MSNLTSIIERELESRAGVNAAVEERESTLILTGMIQSEEERQAALDIVTNLAPDKDVEDNLEVLAVLPEQLGDFRLSEVDAGGFPGAGPQTGDDEALEPGDFTDQE